MIASDIFIYVSQKTQTVPAKVKVAAVGYRV